MARSQSPAWIAERFSQADLFQQQGKLTEAVRLCRAILKAQPDHFDTQHLLSLIRHRQGRAEEAATLLARALRLRPDAVVALSNYGLMLHQLGRHAEALASFDKALALAPGYAEAHYNRGAALDALGRPEEAAASYRKALELRPHHAEALNNLGIALDELGRHEEAVASYDRALALRTDYAEALNNRGTALIELERFDEALASYDRALAVWPDYVECRWNRSLLLLRLGLFDQGWEGFEWRRKRDSFEPRNFSGPEWRGGNASGKRLLFYAEHGLGDTIQFARFARAVAAGGAEVVLEVQRPLTRLLGSLPGLTVAGKGDKLPPCDFHLPLMSLPHVLATSPASIPVEASYLSAEPDRVEAWSKKLPHGAFKVGIAWQGNPNPNIDRGRSIPLRAFAPLARVPGVRLVSLQKYEGVEQLSDLPDGMGVVTLGEFDAGPDAFVDSAAAIINLDLVVTSDTAIAHLAGALGRPVWIVLKRVPDWRWMTERDDTPWYPTARLFRQRRRGDWDEVFSRVAGELNKASTNGNA